MERNLMRNTLLVCFFCCSLVCAFAQTTSRLFDLMPANQTGIDFNNKITDEKEHSILIYANYYGGAGVGIGDFNNDGLEDVFFTGNLVSDRLYLNKGNFQFENITEQAQIIDNGGWSSGVAIADVNQDGWLDIYICRELYDHQPDLRRNVLYINNGDLTFSEKAAEYGLDDNQRTRHATFLDYDKDGDLDLFLLNQPPNPGNYSEFMGTFLLKEEYSPRLYRNDGARFTDVTTAAGVLRPIYPNSVVASDLNNDGWTDLYVASDFDAPDLLYINNGDGTFSEELKKQIPHISYYSMGVDIADINNDGNMDIMTLDMVAEDNYRLKANMGGMYPEAFWKVVENNGHYQYMFNAVHLNNGNNSFSEVGQLTGLSSTDWSWANLIADFDNDGLKDVYVTNGLLRDIRNSDAAKTFPKYVNKKIDEYIKAHPNEGNVSIFDIIDVKEALRLVPSEPLSNYAFKNEGDLKFSKKMKDWGLDQKSFSNGTAYADLDNDGDLDLIVNNINEKAFVYKNQAVEQQKGNYLRVKINNSANKETLLGTRLKIEYNGQQQWLELANVRGMYSTCEQTAHFGLGQNKRVDRLTINWPNGEHTILEQLDVNQVLNIDYAKLSAGRHEAKKEKSQTKLFSDCTATSALGFQHAENEFDDYDKQVLLPHKMSQLGPALTKGDVNGDGLEDVFFGGAAEQFAELYLQQSDGSFVLSLSNVFGQDAAYEDIDAAFFDIDNDGDQDLYVVSGGNAFPQQNKMYQDRVYLNDGMGGFQKSTTHLPKFKDSGACIRPFDYDKDGDLDAFVGGRHVPWDYPSPAISRLLINERGKLVDGTSKKARELVFLGMITDGMWMDFDEDGWTDLILTGEWMDITVLKNEEGILKKVDVAAFSGKTGWWHSLHKVDMDGDGDEDLIAGNLGLNYKYKATPDEPFEVHYDDFDGNQKKDIVLSYYNFGERFPLRGLSCSSQQIPDIKKQFGTYDIFASSDLETVYGKDELEGALHYAATHFASSYFENLGGGQFKMKELPRLAQISSVNAIVSDDFNGDGHLDIALAGNMFQSEIETQRNDGGIGLILLGDGKGNFQPMNATESGFELPFDVKNMIQVNTSKGKMIISANNDEATKVFRLESKTAQNR